MRNSIAMPYKKFVQSVLGRIIQPERKVIEGTFKEKKTGEIIKGDVFECIVTGKGSAEESYKDTLAYFNHTLEKGEGEREFVKAKWIKTDKLSLRRK